MHFLKKQNIGDKGKILKEPEKKGRLPPKE